jgi:hypothetical protein
LAFESLPAGAVEVGVKFLYRPLLNSSGAISFALESGPASATFREDGVLTWEPADADAGSTASFIIVATLDEQSARQEFSVSVSKVQIEVEQRIDTDEGTAILQVDSPLSPI